MIVTTSTVNSREALLQEVLNDTLRSWGIRRVVVLGHGSSLTADGEKNLRRALLRAIPGLNLPERLQVEGSAHDGFRIVNLPR